jgi:LuxR family glucitol operon transcriptional activator
MYNIAEEGRPMDSDEKVHLERLLKINRSNLRELEIQIAKFGILVPPHISLQFEECKSKIKELEDRLSSYLPFNNLGPRDYKHFIGRKKEFNEIIRLLLPHPKSRQYLVTIDGIGGIGKTSLASEVAYYFNDHNSSLPEEERFEAIVWVSAKHAYLTADGILERSQSFRTLQDLFAAIAHVLDYPAITRARAEEQTDLVRRILSQHRTLLVIDNLETIQNDELMFFLRELPDPTKAIITTRHRMDVPFPIRLTGLPDKEALDLISQECNRKGVTLSDDDHNELLRRTGGVPLAIVWSIGLIGLGSSHQTVFRRLSSGHDDIAKFCFEESVSRIRQKSAYKILLSLSLIYVDSDAEATGYIAGLDDDQYARDQGLFQLVCLSLINKAGERYSLLPLTREFVRSEADKDSIWLKDAQERCQNYFLKLAKELGGYSKDWRGQDRVEREMSNILMVIETLVDKLRYEEAPDGNRQLSETSISTAKLLVDFIRVVARTCRIRGYWADCESLCQKAITISKYLNDYDSVGWRYFDLARINFYRGDLVSAHKWALECKKEWQRGELPTAQILRLLGLIMIDQNQLAEAEKFITEAFVEYKSLGKEGTLTNFLESLGKLAEKKGDYLSALEYYMKAADLSRQKNDLVNLTTSLIDLGNLNILLQNNNSAKEAFEESLKLARECGRVDNIAESEFRLGQLELLANNQSEAKGYLQHATELYRRLDIKSKQDRANAMLAEIEGIDS